MSADFYMLCIFGISFARVKLSSGAALSSDTIIEQL